MGDVLDTAFPNPDIPEGSPSYEHIIGRLLVDHIPTPTGSGMESPQEQERLRRQLFGNDYQTEYVRRMRQGLSK